MSVSQHLSRLVPGFVLAAFMGLSIGGGIAPALAQDSAANGAQTVGQYARHYRMYRRNIDDLAEMSFTDIDEVRNARDLAMSYNPQDLSRGWIAHQAIIASRAPGFMETVRTAARSRGQAAFFSEARTSPEYLWTLSSDTAAINFILDGLYQDSTEAEAIGAVLRERALAYMETTYGSRLPSGSANNASELLRTTRPAPRAGGRQYTVAYHSQGIMSQVLELAARLSLDRTDGRGVQATSYLLDNEESSRCIHWAQLNLNQCLAASRNQAEEAYCTGRHAVIEVSECWGWIADLSGTNEHASLPR